MLWDLSITQMLAHHDVRVLGFGQCIVVLCRERDFVCLLMSNFVTRFLIMPRLLLAAWFLAIQANAGQISSITYFLR